MRASRAFFFLRRSFFQRTFGRDPRPMAAESTWSVRRRAYAGGMDAGPPSAPAREDDRPLRETLERVLALPTGFPHLRPVSRSFDRWADALEDPAPTREVIDEGVRRLGRREQRRLTRAFREAMPGATALTGVFLAAAVAAALAERQWPDPAGLERLEERAGSRLGAARALSFVIEPGDVWSLDESTVATASVEALGRDASHADAHAVVTGLAKHLVTRAHRERLTRAVDRLERLEPCTCHPHAWETISAACAAFERDPKVRRRLLVLLLGDSTQGIRRRSLRAA